MNVIAAIVRARLEEAGIEIVSHLHEPVIMSDGSGRCTIVLRVSAADIAEQERVDADPIAILRDRGLL